MLFINFARCHSFDSADLMRNATIADANDNIGLSNLIRECENISLLGVCSSTRACVRARSTPKNKIKIKD